MVNEMSDQDRIATLLAAYGSDVSRWPADGRALIEAMPVEQRDALLRDDRAFDKLIARAAHDAARTPPPDDLMARILAAMPAEPSTATASDAEAGEVVQLPRSAGAEAGGAGVSRRPTRDWAAAAALLAASLMLGFFMGSTDRGQSVAHRVGEIAGLPLSVSSVQTTALDEALQSQDDEDIL